MRRILLAATVLLAGTAASLTAASAKQYQLPDANPAVSITLPDDWKPEDIDKGVQANSPDEETYVAIETAPKKDVDALIKDDIEFLVKNGVTLDTSTQKQQDSTINGIPVSFLHWDGKDKDGPTSVTLVIAGVTDNLLMLMTSWATPKGDKSNGPAMEKILSSMKKM